MEQSKNYNFNLPSKSDEIPADIDLISDNFRTVDDIVKQVQDDVSKTPTNLVNGSAYGSVRGIATRAEGNGYTIGQNAVAIGYDTEASGSNSHAEGYNTTALGDYSHAEGGGTIASGDISHAEGSRTRATGANSHAEGADSIANGLQSHAEGRNTTASGDFSHAEGVHVIASGDYQHAQGKCNIEDTNNKYAHIVGNGEDEENRSNAHTLDWDGNAWFAGDVYVGGTSQDDENATKLSSVATDITQVKEKLDGIEEGANKTIVDSELSDTSTNPLQNKVVTEKINSANSTITSIYNRVKNQVSYLAKTQTANTTLLKIGTFTGDGSGGRAIITLNGKKGWNYKNDGGLKVLTLSSNSPSDANGICTGATFYDFGGSNDDGSEVLDSVQDIQILLVRPQDYAVRKVDVYIKFNSAYQYNSFFINADWAPGTTWEVDVKAITTDTDPTTNALSSFVVPKKQFASLEKVKTKADTETGTCTLTAYSNTVFGTVSNEILLNWVRDTSKYYTTGSTNSDGTLTVQGTGNARIINAYNINATGTVGVEFAVSGTGAIKIEIKGGGKIYTSGNISLSTTTQKIQITHATSGITVLNDMEINIYASGETALKIENLLKMTEASTRTLTGNYDLIGNQVTVSVFVDNLRNGGEIALYPLPFVPKLAKSGVCGAFSSSSYSSSAIYYEIYGGTTARIYLNDAPQANKQLTFYYTV